MPHVAAFTSEANEALDLAKRAVPHGSMLTPELLLAAAYRAGALDQKVPNLAPYLPELTPLTDVAPDQVPVSEPLRPVLGQLLSRSGVTLAELTTAVLRSQSARTYLTGRGMPSGDIDQVIAALGGGQGGAGAWRGSSERESLLAELEPWGRMITTTKHPEKGAMQMDRYLRSLQKNLLKMRRPNALIIGQPGTGKTALVYEFARLIMEGDAKIAPALRDRDVFELSVSLFRAGSGVVGEYEKRVGKLIRIMEEHPQVILFVDEIHSMLQSGIHESGPFTQGDQAFKQAIGKGGFSIIGATTIAEYMHYIQPDGALARRFGLLRIEPPTPEEALRILQGRVEQYRRHYAPLRIDDEILSKAIELSEDLLLTRFQPDKSLDVLDEACAICVMSDPPLEAVTEAVLTEAIEDEVGHSVIKPGTLTADQVAETLHRSIQGQDKAIDTIARGFVAGLSAEWLQHDGPRRIFFFCGPTGTGKTETARRLSMILGGGRESMLRIDCNTLMGSGAEDAGPINNKLLGPPPGYIGYSRGEGGLLSKIREMPQAIVLFDEIEKASPHVGKLLLQILDEGKVEDSDGNLLDFRRAFVVFTTNAGARYGGGPDLGFKGPREARAVEAVPTVTVEEVKDELRQVGYGEEFFGRQIDFVMFEGLTKDVIEKVLHTQLEELRATASERGFRLDWDQAVYDHLLTEWTPRAGARWVFNILRNRIEEQLALAESEGELAGVTAIQIRLLATPGEPAAELGRARRERLGDTLVIFVA
jgi:ATP-dependent Clp protease ATP-binding subunit ClpA